MSALARTTGISRSFLYDVLGGKKNLSPEAGLKIARRLGMSIPDTELFGLLIQLETTRDMSFRESLLPKICALAPGGAVHDLNLDLFRTIADWCHLTILQLTTLEEFKFSPRAVSRKLGITIAESEAAIDRLLRLELLKQNENGTWSKTSNRILVQSRAPDGAITRFHRQILALASDAVGTQPPSSRKGRSEAIPLNPEILDQAETIIDRAYEEIIALAAKSKTRNSVYALSTQFFSLTVERK